MSRLVLENNGSSDRLWASWLPPKGGVESYLVTLRAPGSDPQLRHVLPNITQVEFEGLTPGRSYEVSVSSSAGGQRTESRSTARTGEFSSESRYRGSYRYMPSRQVEVRTVDHGVRRPWLEVCVVFIAFNFPVCLGLFQYLTGCQRCPCRLMLEHCGSAGCPPEATGRTTASS